MGVDVNAEFRYGYKVDFEDIPDGRNRYNDEFADCADEDGYTVTICGNEIWCDALVDGDDAYQDYDNQTWYIGVEIPTGETPERLAEVCHELDETVKTMYELVMRKPPTEEPMIHVYTRWW
jgi:hypothetical protein